MVGYLAFDGQVVNVHQQSEDRAKLGSSWGGVLKILVENAVEWVLVLVADAGRIRWHLEDLFLGDILSWLWLLGLMLGSDQPLVLVQKYPFIILENILKIHNLPWVKLRPVATDLF